MGPGDIFDDLYENDPAYEGLDPGPGYQNPEWDESTYEDLLDPDDVPY